MATIRQEKVAKLLQQELAVIFQRETRNFFTGALITVTVVRISPDLGVAKVYLSIFMPKGRDEIFEKIREENWRIRKWLGEKVGKQLRIVPNLQFFLDDSLDYADEIDRLLKK